MTEPRGRLVDLGCTGPRRFCRVPANCMRGGLCSTTGWMEVRVAQDVFGAQTPRRDAMMRMCSWCKRVQLDEDWMTIEQALAESRLPERPNAQQVTHGV